MMLKKGYLRGGSHWVTVTVETDRLEEECP
jgi:hypothetical protein